MEDDPYMVDPAASYEVRLDHGTSGNVTDSEFSQISVGFVGLVIEDDPLPATFDPDTNSLVVESDGAGRFRLFGRYGGIYATDLYFKVIDPDNVAPFANLNVDVAEGI